MHMTTPRPHRSAQRANQQQSILLHMGAGTVGVAPRLSALEYRCLGFAAEQAQSLDEIGGAIVFEAALTARGEIGGAIVFENVLTARGDAVCGKGVGLGESRNGDLLIARGLQLPMHLLRELQQLVLWTCESCLMTIWGRKAANWYATMKVVE